MRLVNIHCHMLYAVDDGAKSPNMMMHMIDSAYKSGVRVICMTPHYNPAYFKCPREIIVKRFAKSVDYVAEKYPDLKLCLGQELYYYNDTVSDLLHGKCFTLNRTRNVLVEFGPYDDKAVIEAGVSRLLTSGFTPVIAHVERYSSLRFSTESIRELKRQGAVIQVNAASVLGVYGFLTKQYVVSLIRKGLVDIIADDCHDVAVNSKVSEKDDDISGMTDSKAESGGVFAFLFGNKKDKKNGTAKKLVCLREAYDYVHHKFGEEAADVLFCINPLKMISEEFYSGK